jgi:hypothetical protein
MARCLKKHSRNSNSLRSPWRKKRKNSRKSRKDSKVRVFFGDVVSDLTIRLDKTQGFSNQIKAKQQELQPWTAQISEKQAAIDIARSEHTTLSTKVEETKNAGSQAKEQLENVKAERQEKVSSRMKASRMLYLTRLGRRTSVNNSRERRQTSRKL